MASIQKKQLTVLSEPRFGNKFHPSIYQWNLPVFPGMANKAHVANTVKLWLK